MPGATYYYAVRAINSSGAGAWSAIDQASAGIGNPDAPTLTATAIDDDSIRLTWNVPNNNGTTITGYELQRWDPTAGNDGQTEVGTTTTCSEQPPTPSPEYINIGLDPGTKYYYRVRALPQLDDQDGS